MGTKVLHHVDVKLVDLGTVKARRQNAEVAGLPQSGFLLRFYLFCSGRLGQRIGGKKRKRNTRHADQQGTQDSYIKEG